MSVGLDRPKIVHVYVDVKTHRRVKSKAAARGQSIAGVVRECLSE